MSRMTRRAFIRSTAYLAGGGMCALSTGSSLLLPVESWASHIAFQETSCGENHPNRTRPDDIHAHCLQYQGIKCLKCESRCPVDAISEETAHDKEACMQRVAASTKYCNRHYHIFIYGCGLCATRTPCESGIPEALLKSVPA